MKSLRLTRLTIIFLHSFLTASQKEFLRFAPSDLGTGNRYGDGVSMDGDIVAVSDYEHSRGLGAVYIYYRNEGGADNWGLKKKLVGEATDSDFGRSTGLSGSNLVVGAPTEDVAATDSGHSGSHSCADLRS